jgi:ESCRT-I complex subunit TSG101
VFSFGQIVLICNQWLLIRLLNAYAEEAATEDAIYYLGEGLRRGVIELDVFLKNVRSLSRKQFMLRALMERCRQQAGLNV